MRYDAIADRYDLFVREQSVIHRVAIPVVLELAQPSGARVLDLACGQGVLARALARRGDAVTAVDISAPLLDIARRVEESEALGIQYINDDARALATLGDGSFDGVVSSLTFTDFDDLAAVLASVFRVLKVGGWFVFAALHPCFEPPHARTTEVEGRAAKQVNGYFEEGPWSSKNPDSLVGLRHHRRLSTILNGLLDAGFTIDRLAEPQGTANVLELAPIYGEVSEVLVVRASR